MFKNAKKTQTTTSKVQTLVGAECTIKGTIEGSNSIKIEGTILGDINWDDTVIMEQGSICTGNISCANSIISGNVTGNITCSDSLTITSTGNINGDVLTSIFVIDEGGTLDGKCSMVYSDANKENKTLFFSDPSEVKDEEEKDDFTIDLDYEDKE